MANMDKLKRVNEFGPEQWDQYATQVFPLYHCMLKEEIAINKKELGFTLEIYKDQEYQLSKLKSCHHLFYSVNDKVVGVLAYSGGETFGEIELLYVQPSERSNGIGTSLIEHFKTMFLGKEIFITARISNTGAYQLYQRLGFIPSTTTLILKEE